MDDEKDKIYFYLKDRYEVIDQKEEMGLIQSHLQQALVGLTEVTRSKKNHFAFNHSKGREKNYTEYIVVLSSVFATFNIEERELPDLNDGERRFSEAIHR